MPCIAQVGLTNDKTGKRFEPGEVVQFDDFPEGVIRNWIELGVLVGAEVELIDVTQPEDPVMNFKPGKLITGTEALERANHRKAGEDVPDVVVRESDEVSDGR